MNTYFEKHLRTGLLKRKLLWDEHAGTIEKGIDQYVAHASVLLTKNIKVTTPFSFGEAFLKDVEKEMLHLSSKKTRYVSKYTTKIF